MKLINLNSELVTRNNLRSGFTLIEILVVSTIIAVLAAGSFISYRAIVKSGRDATRKAHLEQIRSAIEQYRTNNVNGSYPDGDDISVACDSVGAISDGTNTYLSKMLVDPSCDTYKYSYAPLTASGAGCDSTNPATPCLDYTLSSYLENATSADDCLANQCGTNINCRYCLGPYGEK